MPCEDYEDDATLSGDARLPVFRRLVGSVCRAVHDTYEHPRDVLSQLRSLRVFGAVSPRRPSTMGHEESEEQRPHIS
jgi:hypothetical protein